MNRRALVVIGNFDGVHRGHQEVLRAAVLEAEGHGLPVVALTFEPHPAEVLGKPRAAMLTGIERKVELISRIDPRLSVAVEPFTLELAQQSPRDFASTLLSNKLGARIVVVGENFRFGYQRAGDLAALTELGSELGFTAHTHPLAGDLRGPFSSSRARQALAAGALVDVENVLGRPHAFSGSVVRGDGRGRSIGIPTANLASVLEALPPHGVYATQVDLLESGARSRVLGMAVTNIGVRPTFAAGASIETHLLDFDGELYGRQLRLHVLARVREERRFAGAAELGEQIRSDIEVARGLLAGRRAAD